MKSEKAKSEYISEFLSFIRQCDSDYCDALATAVETEKQAQDIIHAVEFGTYNPKRSNSLLRKLQEVRLERRKAKNTQELLCHVSAWAADHAQTVKALERLLGEMRKIERKQASRLYAQRTDVMEGMLKE